MPVSSTVEATTAGEPFRANWSGLHPRAAVATLSVTPPFSVNLKALESRLRRICWSRLRR